MILTDRGIHLGEQGSREMGSGEVGKWGIGEVGRIHKSCLGVSESPE
ncbi:MAG: hypothetical protein O9350_05260 [Microcystis sp. LE19-388.1G]|nr:hypothetical protein [Microcystis sp. LE19-388.1G]